MIAKNPKPTKILIVGGGFGGVRAALDLGRARLQNAKITIVSDKPHFEYHAALYRLVTGRSPLEVCIPLTEIFAKCPVELLSDRIEAVDLRSRTAKGLSGASYRYDFLILALGSETSYFDIPGLKEYSFGFKSINEALRLKAHIHNLLETSHTRKIEDKIQAAHFVIVGGGASGVEIAGELARYLLDSAAAHDFDPRLVVIDLVEAGPSLLGAMPPAFVEVITRRLRRLGVNIFLNRAVMREDFEQLYLKDMEMKIKTVVWTAGVKPNRLYSQIAGLTLDHKGRVKIDDYLNPPGFPDIFVIGDAAATVYSGMAQTAIHDGRYAAQVIGRKLKIQRPEKYVPKKPFYAIPVGPGWAGAILNGVRLYGYVGWMFRRLADLRFFLSILPLPKAIIAFRNEKTLCESCMICSLEAPAH